MNGVGMMSTTSPRKPIPGDWKMNFDASDFGGVVAVPGVALVV
jgi:hypothetical protein